MINDNLRQQRHDRNIPSNLLVLFDRPLASFTNNIIYIDCPNNCKTRIVVVCTIFFLLFENNFLPHTTQQFLRLYRYHLSYRGENDKKSCLKYSIHCCFPTYFPASFLSRFLSEKPTQAHTSGFSHQNMRNKMPLCLNERNNLFPGSLDHFQSLVPKLLNVF